MAKISTYATVAPVAADLVLGTDSGAADATKNFTVQSLFDAAITLPAHQDDSAAGATLSAGQLYQTTGTGAAPLNTPGIVMVKQ
jgi:hypothetical protein